MVQEVRRQLEALAAPVNGQRQVQMVLACQASTGGFGSALVQTKRQVQVVQQVRVQLEASAAQAQTNRQVQVMQQVLVQLEAMATKAQTYRQVQVVQQMHISGGNGVDLCRHATAAIFESYERRLRTGED